MNPYESPRFVSASKRWLWCTFIIAMWMNSAGIAGFAIGLICYHIPGFERLARVACVASWRGGSRPGRH